jgi:AraC-like DNA-binding protein
MKAWDRAPREPTAATYESVLALVRLLMRRGVPAAEIVQATGLALDAIHHPDARVPLSQLERLWVFASQRLQNPGIALELHSHYPENKLHFVAHLGMRCPTMRSAIEHWRKYAALVAEPDEVDYVVEGSTARFRYRCNDPRYESRWFAEHFLSLAVWFARNFTGLEIELKAVRMMHPDPRCPEAYARAFGPVPVEFWAMENSVAFDASALDLPFRTADRYLHHFLSAQAEELKQLHERGAPIENRVVCAIAMLLAKGEDVGLHSVAAALQLPARRLQLALEASGQRFRDLLDQVRRETATRYLKRGLSISQVALLLGFSEPSALQHAFKRWYATSPGNFRDSI